jgi:hypothetical protein
MTPISFENGQYPPGDVARIQGPELLQTLGEEELKLEPYLPWGHSAMQRLHDNGPDDPVVARLFSFLNGQFANPDSEHNVLELLTIQIFENFAQEEKSLEYARQNTKDEARQSLEESIWWTGVDSPEECIAPEAAVRRQQLLFNRKYKGGLRDRHLKKGFFQRTSGWLKVASH